MLPEVAFNGAEWDVAAEAWEWLQSKDASDTRDFEEMTLPLSPGMFSFEFKVFDAFLGLKEDVSLIAVKRYLLEVEEFAASAPRTLAPMHTDDNQWISWTTSIHPERKPGLSLPVDASGNRLKRQSLTMLVDDAGCKHETITVPEDKLIPIFIIVVDRMRCLQRCIEDIIDVVTSPYEIIILDQGSTYPGMLEYQQQLEEAGIVSIVRKKAQTFEQVISNIASSVKSYLISHPDVHHYAVTDGDISLRGCQGDILLFMAGVLDACPRIAQVGTSLRISNLGNTFKDRVQEDEGHWWKSSIVAAEWRGFFVNLLSAAIDTTFAVRKRTQEWSRLQSPSMRVLGPYMAEHIPWYSTNPSPDELHGFQGVSHYTLQDNLES